MKASKAKVKRSDGAKNGRVYTVNVARMDQYLTQTRDAFKDRVNLSHQAREEFSGALAGTVSKCRVTK